MIQDISIYDSLLQNMLPVSSMSENPTDHYCQVANDDGQYSTYRNQYNRVNYYPISSIKVSGLAPNLGSNPRMPLSSSGHALAPTHNTSGDCVPSSEDHRATAPVMSESGGNIYFVDSHRVSCTRKNVDVVPGYCGHANGAGSSNLPITYPYLMLQLLQLDDPYRNGVNLPAATVLTQHGYEGNSVLPTMGGSHRSMTSRSSSHSHQGNHMAPSFQFSSNAWMEQTGNFGDGGCSNWNYKATYMHGRSLTSGHSESRFMGRQEYKDALDATLMSDTELDELENVFYQHDGMRMDMEDISYEDLLSLEELIGDVKNGCSENFISKNLVLSLHGQQPTASQYDPTSRTKPEDGMCIICQSEYKENDLIGNLDCGHKHHAECIRRCLVIENLCPICKQPAFSIGKEKDKPVEEQF